MLLLFILPLSPRTHHYVGSHVVVTLLCNVHLHAERP